MAIFKWNGLGSENILMRLSILSRYLAYIASAAIPALVAFFLVRHYFDTSLYSFSPVWNDEIDYWHEILSFSQNGFSIGYYTIEEIPSPLSEFTHFGTHGPFFPILYGGIARITGWLPSSGPLFNLCFISAAIVIFLSLIRANLYTALLATAAFVSFLPIQFYIPSTMQEPLHYAIAILLAGLFHRYQTDEGRPRWLLAAIPAMLTIASLIRPTWSILFIPYLFLTFSANSHKSKALLLISGALISGIFLFAFALYSAPYPDSFVSGLLAILSSSSADAFKHFASHLASNLEGYFSLHDPFVAEKSLRIQFVVAAIFGTIIHSGFRKFNNYRFESLIHICNLLIPFAFVIALYDVGDWRDYRVMAPHILFSWALFSARKKTLPCMIMLAISLLTIPAFSGTYKQLHTGHFQKDAQSATMVREDFPSIIRYRKDVSPWGNSILVDISSLQPFLVGLPAGIGINAVIDWNRIRYPLKSEFVLIEPEIYSQISYKVRLRPIVSGNHGTLYLNLDSPGIN